MSNMFGVYDVEIKGAIATDDAGSIQEVASIDTGEVSAVASIGVDGNVTSVWTPNMFGGSNEYNSEGDLQSYSVPDTNYENVEHVYDADDNLVAISVEETHVDEGEYDSISLDDFV